MLKTSWKYALALVCAATLACNSGKAPAEAAMKLAEEAVNSARTEAENLVPDDFQSLSDDLAAAKDAIAKGDYKGALASAQSIQQKANDVTAKAKAKKDELTATWTACSRRRPEDGRGDQEPRRHPVAVEEAPQGARRRASSQSAKDGLAAATSTWAEAQAALRPRASGTTRSPRRNQVKDKATAAMAALGMQAGGELRPPTEDSVPITSSKGPRERALPFQAGLTPTRSSRAAST